MKTECISEFVSFNDKTYPCPISVAMNLVGGKWKSVIIITCNMSRSASTSYGTTSFQRPTRHSPSSSSN